MGCAAGVVCAATTSCPSVRRRAPGVGFAPGGGGCGDSGAGAGGLFDHWRVVRPLAGLLAGWAGWSAGLWLVSGSAGGVFAGWRLVRRQWPNTPSSGGRSPGWGLDGVRWWGPRTPCRGCDGRWRCGGGDLGHRVGTWDRSCRVRGRDLVSEPPPCAPVERPGRRDLLRWCTKCRFRESRGPGQRNTPNFRARQLPNVWAATPRTPGAGNSSRTSGQATPRTSGRRSFPALVATPPSGSGIAASFPGRVGWVKSRNLFRSRRDAKRS